MLLENLSAKVGSVRNIMCYERRCEGFKELVLEIHQKIRRFKWNTEMA